ncbi:MAG TPA: glycosyltransferase family 2 protein [Holophaga sp.]|nr:glycosyltransferase family 2 protein [Holophaga sp.]
MPKISIITPVYNEEATVRHCHAEIRRIMTSLGDGYTYEHIFGDNCSRDRTLEILREIAREDPHVKVLAYSRNFGAEKSGVTLLRHASGDAVVGVVADLQEPPELIPRMVELWEQGNDMVLGIYENHSDGWFKKRVRSMYYRLASWVSNEELERNTTGYGLLDRRVVDILADMDDYAPYVRGWLTTMGFRKAWFHYQRRPRTAGESKHGYSFLMDFGLNALISYSILPIRLATYLGLTLSGLSLLLSVVYACIKLWKWNFQAPGATTTIVLVLFFSGIQLLFLGILGEYIGAIHAQVRRKPFCLIRERINFED